MLCWVCKFVVRVAENTSIDVNAGLGDTNYSNFCNTAKRLDRKFSDLGAESFLTKGFADDATG